MVRGRVWARGERKRADYVLYYKPNILVAVIEVKDIEDLNLLRVQPLSQFGAPVEIIKKFGERDAYLTAVRELESELYAG